MSFIITILAYTFFVWAGRWLAVQPQIRPYDARGPAFKALAFKRAESSSRKKERRKQLQKKKEESRKQRQKKEEIGGRRTKKQAAAMEKEELESKQ